MTDPRTAAQALARVRHCELCNEHAAVAELELPDGSVSLVARDADGTPRVAELILVDRAAPAPPEDALRELGNTRGQALRLAEQATDHLVATLAVQLRAGQDVNLSAVSRDSGIARQTLYNRLNELGIDP